MSFVVPVKEMPRMEYQLPPPQVPQVGVAAGVGVGTHQLPAVVGLPGTLPHVQAAAAAAQDEPARWTQYQHLWRQHVYMNGRVSI